MNIADFDYDLPDEQIAKFPLDRRDASRLLVWRSDEISETGFADIGSVLPPGSLLVFNNTRVVRARLVMHKQAPEGMSTPGARIEILCLEPSDPADYERAFAARGSCEWICMVGNLKKWKAGPLEIPYIYSGTSHTLRAWRGNGQIVRFEWDADPAFGELLELLGRVPIPPYLGREGEAIDNTRYQTVYARTEGSVAAPTAGLHFTPELIDRLRTAGIETEEVTLHVGAGTFLPIKTDDALDHPMHTEHFEVTLAAIEGLTAKTGKVIAVGTTSVRTLESLPALAWRVKQTGDPELSRQVGQFESYEIPPEFDGRTAVQTLATWMREHGLDRLKAATRIMITPAGFKFRIVDGLITNFHQPKSTLLLLIAALTGGQEWRRIYNHALAQGFRFLSYGDSSLLLR